MRSWIFFLYVFFYFVFYFCTLLDFDHPNVACETIETIECKRDGWKKEEPSTIVRKQSKTLKEIFKYNCAHKSRSAKRYLAVTIDLLTIWIWAKSIAHWQETMETIFFFGELLWHAMTEKENLIEVFKLLHFKT